jgi:O-antigen/teichoic acid export membrane protein
MRLVGSISVMTLSHLIVNGLAFLSIPFLISHFGASAFAAIAFYLAFQMWLVTFDLGFTPALIRELAPRLRENDEPTDRIADLVSTYRSFFMLAAGCIVLIFSIFFSVNQTFERFSGSAFIELSILIALIGGLRFYVTVEKALYRAAEKFSRLAILNVIFALLRYVLIFPFMADSQSLLLFFQYQLIVAVVEALVYPSFNPRVKHELNTILTPKFNLIVASKELIGYSAIAGLMWLAIVNIDKFFLFGSVEDATYSHYSVMLQLASLPMLLLAPISGVVQPRVAAIVSEGGTNMLVRFLTKYHAALTSVVVSVGLFIGIVFPLMFAIWTGDLLPENMEGLILFFLMGYSFLSHGLTSYLIQFAFKDLRFHGLSHLIVGVIYLPLVAFLSTEGRLQLIGISWLVMTALLSQAGGFYVAMRMLNKYLAAVLYFPAWCIWIFMFWIIKNLDSLWVFENKSEAFPLMLQNLFGLGVLGVSTVLVGVIIFFTLSKIFKNSETVEALDKASC